jgi:metal-responsive CopG/Arc/MetJ family transcriptional regulator
MKKPMKNNDKYGIPIAVRVDSELMDRIDRLQEAEQRGSRGELIRLLLTEALTRREAAGKRKR